MSITQIGDYWIDSDFKDELSSLSELEFFELEKSILKEGQRTPIQYFVFDSKKIIVDGHHRLKVCLKNNLPIKSEELNFDGQNYDELKKSILEWMMSNQLSRRNVPIFVKIEYVLKNQKAFLKLAPKEIKKANDKLAHILNTSSATIKRAKKILSQSGDHVIPVNVDDQSNIVLKVVDGQSGDHVIPDILKGLRDGSKTISEVYKELLRKGTGGKLTPEDKVSVDVQSLGHVTHMDVDGQSKDKIEQYEILDLKTKMIESYILEKEISLYGNYAVYDDLKVLIDKEMLKSFLVYLDSVPKKKIKVNENEVEIGVDSINYNGMILSKGLLEVMIEDLEKQTKKKQTTK